MQACPNLFKGCPRRHSAALLPHFSSPAPQAAEAWWELVLREETLGRVVWIVENTLSTALLERA